MKKIKVIVICVPNSKRADPLLLQLGQSQIFQIEIFSAVMYSRSSSQHKPNFSKQKAVYGRELSDGEIGSAISHFHVQVRCSKDNSLSVILEDDARIKNLKLFEETILDFESMRKNTSSVLTLLPWDPDSTSSYKSHNVPRIIKLAGEPPLTVGYAATSHAMANLGTFNSDFAYLPDWPPNNVNFFTTIPGVISHGDENTESLIDKAGRIKTSRFNRLIRLTLLPYLRNRNLFLNFKEYFQVTIKRSFTWRIDKLKINLELK